MTYQELYRFGTAELENAKIEDAAYDARELLLGISGLSRSSLALEYSTPVSLNLEEQYRRCISRRKEHYPLQYILGEWDFYGLTLKVGEGVLIPRPETELLVDFALDFLRKSDGSEPVIWDLCAGSGCIGLAIAVNCPRCRVLSLEKSSKAYSFLQQNVELCGMQDRVTPILGDLLSGPGILLSETSQNPTVIVSNPPYIEQSEISELQTEVQFEPSMALDGGKDGLLFYRSLAEQWLPCLKKGGLLAVECGERQGNEIASLFQPYCEKADIFFDYAGLERGVLVRT